MCPTGHRAANAMSIASVRNARTEARRASSLGGMGVRESNAVIASRHCVDMDRSSHRVDVLWVLNFDIAQ